MTSQASAKRPLHHNYVDGRWVPARDGAVRAKTNPANGEFIGQFAHSGPADVEAAVAAAERARAAWARTSPAARAEFVRRAATLLMDRIEGVASDLTREEGKTLAEARVECRNAVAKLNYAAAEGLRLNGEILATAEEGLHLFTLREPLGVVAAISPWNFPLSTPASKVGIALVCGNTVVMKPATATPLSSVHFMQTFADAGLPAGVLNLVTGSGGTVGGALVGDARVRGVSFTGSTAIGIDIGRRAAGNLAKVQLELGGKNPLVVMEDADLDAAARAAVDGAFLSCGQKCTATSRVIVHRDVKAGLTKRILEKTAAIRVGDGLDPTSYMGPVVDEGQAESVCSYIDIGRREGAHLLIGGERLRTGALARGYFVSPAVFDEVGPGMRIAREEIFGPVMSILTADSFEHALEVANDCAYGLSSAIYTRSLRYAHEFARGIQAGVVKVNGQTPGNAVNAPFGGRKQSGVNICLKAVDFYTELKAVYQRFA